MSSYRIYWWKENTQSQPFRWHAKATNGKIVASGEGYRRRVDMMTMLGRLFPTLEVEEIAPPSHGGR